MNSEAQAPCFTNFKLSKRPTTYLISRAELQIFYLLLHFFLGLIGKVQNFSYTFLPFWVVWYPPPELLLVLLGTQIALTTFHIMKTSSSHITHRCTTCMQHIITQVHNKHHITSSHLSLILS